MKNTLRLTESEFIKFIERIINESENEIDEITYDDYMGGESLQLLRNALDKNQMVSVAYVKKDGSVRHMLVKRNISFYVRSDREKTEKQVNVESNNNIKRVVDFTLYRKNLKDNGGDKEMAAKSCWRTINLKDVLGFSAGGRFIDLRQENDIFNRFGETTYGSLTKSMVRAMETEQGDVQMGIEETINEGVWSKMMKGVRAGEGGPWSIVAIQDKKVVGQKNDIKIQDIIPAHYESMKREFPDAKIHIEDSTGYTVWTNGSHVK